MDGLKGFRSVARQLISATLLVTFLLSFRFAQADIWYDIEPGSSDFQDFATSGSFSVLGDQSDVISPPGFPPNSFSRTAQFAVSVTHGSLRLFAFANVVNLVGENSTVGIDIEANAGFSDMLTITSPSVANGMTGQTTLDLLIDGVVSGTNEIRNVSGIDVNTSRTTGELRFQALGGTVSESIDLSNPQVINGSLLSLVVPFVYGVPFDYQLDITFDASACCTGPIYGASARTALLDFGNTISWAGKPVVTRDDTGEIVTDFALMSVSGTDYSVPIVAAPVPLPAGFWLFLSAFAVLNRGKKRLS